MKILDRLPFYETRSEIWTPDRLATVKPYQIIVTVSLAVRELIEPDLGLPRFPAVLDTGNNHNFAIREEQLRSWDESCSQNHAITLRFKDSGYP